MNVKRLEANGQTHSLVRKLVRLRAKVVLDTPEALHLAMKPLALRVDFVDTLRDAFDAALVDCVDKGSSAGRRVEQA